MSDEIFHFDWNLQCGLWNLLSLLLSPSEIFQVIIFNAIWKLSLRTGNIATAHILGIAVAILKLVLERFIRGKVTYTV